MKYQLVPLPRITVHHCKVRCVSRIAAVRALKASLVTASEAMIDKTIETGGEKSHAWSACSTFRLTASSPLFHARILRLLLVQSSFHHMSASLLRYVHGAVLLKTQQDVQPQHPGFFSAGSSLEGSVTESLKATFTYPLPHVPVAVPSRGCHKRGAATGLGATLPGCRAASGTISNTCPI